MLTGNDATELVDSVAHPLSQRIRDLLDRSVRWERGEMLIDDEDNVLQALAAGVRVRALFAGGDARISPALQARLPADATLHRIAPRTCKKLFENDRVSRLFAIAETPSPLPVASIAGLRGDLLILDGLSISGNTGAIIRTARALGAGGVVVADAAPVDLYDRRLIRASRGHLFALPVIAATREEVVDACRRSGVALVATSPRGGMPVADLASADSRLAFVLGSEKDGCSSYWNAHAACDVAIPIDDQVESLNVSVAAAILLFARRFARPL